MQKLLKNDVGNNELELEALYYEYLNNLRDYYTAEFCSRAKNLATMNAVVTQKAVILKECDSAMRAATPKNGEMRWSYEVIIYNTTICFPC